MASMCDPGREKFIYFIVLSMCEGGNISSPWAASADSNGLDTHTDGGVSKLTLTLRMRNGYPDELSSRGRKNGPGQSAGGGAIGVTWA